MEEKWLTWAKEIQALAQSGLAYSKNVYDIERYEQLRDLSKEIMASYTNVSMEKLDNLFTNEVGYQTPKVDIRGFIVENGQILLVQEKIDEKWALPGGWADVGLSPKEIVIKECMEEANIEVNPKRVLAIYDYLKHEHPPSPYHVYKVFIHCERISGDLKGGLETHQVQFFSPEELPELSVERNTKKQILQLWEDVTNDHSFTRFD
ncbi:NUDIX hydrolase [Radiobacillus kanasensis]|uniref:NUDIX hydrolase n=1 Tax=Radiobacillus kanasensis TaxID=2844358 RepID=UPI001E3E1F81|nr:NUDIX hydrolase [Radiobacillus kanasensis]UFU00449.1 NUDIX hydrolase [Radiobacillus kanasensis]